MPSLKKLRVGIIGCGGIARSHADGWKKNGCDVIAVTDVSVEAMDKFAQDIGGEVATFQDAPSLIDSGMVDVVSVCSPPVAHSQSVIYALENDVHVLCEKPLADSPANGKRIVQAAKISRAKCMTAFRHRFLPAIVAMKQKIAAGDVGDVVFFHNRFYGPAFHMKDTWFTRKAIAGGGCMLDTSSHSVDLFRFLIGEVVEQSALMSQHFEGTDVEDAAILLLKSTSGALGSLSSAFVTGDGSAYIDVTGQDGRLLYDYFQADVLKYKKRGQNDWQLIPVQPSNGFTEQIAAFCQCLQDDSQPPVPMQEGQRCLEVLFAAYESRSAS